MHKTCIDLMNLSLPEYLQFSYEFEENRYIQIGERETQW